jgi:hypothetical protein
MSRWTKLLETAIHAPHNVQPWRARILSDATADLLIEKHRTLPKEDPTGSLIILTLGLFIEVLTIVAAIESLKPEYELHQALSQFTPEHSHTTFKSELDPFAAHGQAIHRWTAYLSAQALYSQMPFGVHNNSFIRSSHNAWIPTFGPATKVSRRSDNWKK